MKEVELYTDGACRGNPGPGGYGAVLKYRQYRKELSGGYLATTNNRMEILGVIAGLSALTEPCTVNLYSDSRYVVDAVSKGWLHNWQRKNWQKSDKTPVLNIDLWQQLLPLLAKHQVRCNWVRGHADNPENNRCDELAVQAATGRNLHPDGGFIQ